MEASPAEAQRDPGDTQELGRNPGSALAWKNTESASQDTNQV